MTRPPGNYHLWPMLLAAAWTPAATVTVYWSAVVAKAVRVKRRRGKGPNVIPRERVGRYLRLIWAPVVVAWIMQTYFYPLRFGPAVLWLFRPWFDAPTELLMRSIVGAWCCFMALVFTFSCWKQMGSSWRIGIDPAEKTCLIMQGPYRRVRHPIYALSILLMAGCLLVIATPLLALTACVHISLLIWEARREEAYLLQQHGEAYQNYRRGTGRFLPGRRAL